MSEHKAIRVIISYNVQLANYQNVIVGLTIKLLISRLLRNAHEG